MRPVMIIVRDGWGYNENPKGNAVMAAKTPNVDSYKEKSPWTLIHTSGARSRASAATRRSRA